MEQVIMTQEVIEEMIDSIKNPVSYKKGFLDVMLESELVIIESETASTTLASKYDDLLKTAKDKN